MSTHVGSPSHIGYDYNPKGNGRKGTGLIVVVILHLLIGWALVSGLARKAVEIVKKPIQMAVLEEMPVPPPPPPPPPKVERIEQTPTVQAPPPPYVPPPDIAAPVQQTAPVIQAVQAEPPKAPPVIAPPPPPAPPAAPPAPARAEASVACPGYQKTLQAALQGAFEKVGLEGSVKVLIRLHGNQIVDVTPQSGPREYYRLVQGAVKRLTCTAGGADELLVPLDVSFREE